MTEFYSLPALGIYVCMQVRNVFLAFNVSFSDNVSECTFCMFCLSQLQHKNLEENILWW